MKLVSHRTIPELVLVQAFGHDNLEDGVVLELHSWNLVATIYTRLADSNNSEQSVQQTSLPAHEGGVTSVDCQVEDSLVRAFDYKGQWVLATRKFFVYDKEGNRTFTAMRTNLNIESISQL